MAAELHVKPRVANSRVANKSVANKPARVGQYSNPVARALYMNLFMQTKRAIAAGKASRWPRT